MRQIAIFSAIDQNEKSSWIPYPTGAVLESKMSDHDPSYSEKLAMLLRKGMQSSPVFLDVGAHRGAFTLMLKQHFPDAHVHAIEADPTLCVVLERSFEDDDRVDIWNFALHEGTGEIEFFEHANRGTSSVLNRPTSARRYFHSQDQIAANYLVPATSLDQFLVERDIHRVNLLKMDTQGAEGAIIRGSRQTLAREIVDVIYTEFFIVPHYENAPLLHQLCAQLAEYGYTLFDLFKGPYGLNGQLRFGDAIFVSSNFRAMYLDTDIGEP